MCSIFGSHNSQSSKSSTDQSATSTTTPNVPQWMLDRWAQTNGSLNTAGQTPDQQAVAQWLAQNMKSTSGTDAATSAANSAGTALTGANASAASALDASNDVTNKALTQIGNFSNGIAGNSATINNATDYLQNQQNNGSFTLGAYFGDQTPSSATPTAVTAGTGGAYAGNYNTPLNDQYVNASLADFDANAANGANALRAQNADAFANKRTGVAQGQYQSDSDRARATLDSSLRLNAFNTAQGLGQSDANRALAADTTSAGNLLNNNQFNASMTNQRQQFDLGQAETGEDRRLGVANSLISGANTGAGVNTQGVNAATAGANVGAQGLNNTVNVGNSGVSNAVNVGNSGVNNTLNANNGNLQAALASGNFGNMTFQQLMSLLQSGTAGIGNTTNSSGTSNTASSGNSTTIGAGGSFKI